MHGIVSVRTCVSLCICADVRLFFCLFAAVLVPLCLSGTTEDPGGSSGVGEGKERIQAGTDKV